MAQSSGDALQARLKSLFPAASAFSAKQGTPPHFAAYGADGAAGKNVIGYAFWTTDVDPLERGYDGPIKMLVGMDPKGVLTGVILVEHKEPYGDFSIERPAFAAHFKNKDIRDPFRLGTDVDAVSRATITMSSAVRASASPSARPPTTTWLVARVPTARL